MTISKMYGTAVKILYMLIDKILYKITCFFSCFK